MTEVTRPTAPLPAAPAGGPKPSGGEVWLPVVRVAAVVVTIALVGFGTLMVVSTFFQRVHTENRTFTGTVTTVQVSEDVGDVKVRVAETGEQSRVTARITESIDDARWSADLTGGVLAVEGSCRQDGFSLFDCVVDLTLVVPAGIPVVIESSTGNVDVDGGFSAVSARTNTGDITVQRAAGSVDIRTNTGDVRSLATSGTTVSAETTTGDVRLVFDVVPRTVSTETNTGDVSVLVPDDGGVYGVFTDTRTGDASVDVGNVAGSRNQISAQTNTGDIRVAYR
jgi:DUF4097 and DUF4098 domain-containing protein YvlB